MGTIGHDKFALFLNKRTKGNLGGLDIGKRLQPSIHIKRNQAMSTSSSVKKYNLFTTHSPRRAVGLIDTKLTYSSSSGVRFLLAHCKNPKNWIFGSIMHCCLDRPWLNPTNYIARAEGSYCCHLLSRIKTRMRSRIIVLRQDFIEMLITLKCHRAGILLIQGQNTPKTFWDVQSRKIVVISL